MISRYFQQKYYTGLFYVVIISLIALKVYGDAPLPNIYSLVSEAKKIVIASVVKGEGNISDINPQARIKIHKWIKSDSDNIPNNLTIHGLSGRWEDNDFITLEKGKQFLIFISENNIVHGYGSVTEIKENGDLFGFHAYDPIEPLSKTITTMVERIKTIMSEEDEKKK